jgi:serine protease Do
MFASSHRKALLGAVLLGTAAGAFAATTSLQDLGDGFTQGGTSASQSFAEAPANGGSLADMVERVGPAVVQIEARIGDQVSEMAFDGLPFGVDPRSPFGGRGNGQPEMAVGSGFVIDASGIVVTNNHVVENAQQITVKLSDGRELPGRVLGRDPKTDLAVVKIDGGGPFEAIAWGDSDHARVGDDIFAVGSPFGLGNTVTSGIVSARGREIGAGPYDDFLQVDAPINSGNSGGPLFNAAGHVIGVNTAIFSPSGGNVGIGFAIPSRLAQSVVAQIVKEGHVSRGRIGVALQPLNPEIAQQLGLSDTKGALIADVESGGPAATAGLQRGDVVTAFNGRPIPDSRELARAVASAKPGATLSADFIRDGHDSRVNLRIAEMSDS